MYKQGGTCTVQNKHNKFGHLCLSSFRAAQKVGTPLEKRANNLGSVHIPPYPQLYSTLVVNLYFFLVRLYSVNLYIKSKA